MPTLAGSHRSRAFPSSCEPMAYIPRLSYRLRARASTGARCFAPDISAVPIWPAITLPSAGGARFFLQTPAWAALRPGVALRALVGGGGSLMPVEHQIGGAAGREGECT